MRPRGAAGYTLLEMLVVLAVIALLVSISLGVSNHRASAANPLIYARRIEADLGRARALAMTRGVSIDVNFDLVQKAWSIGDEVQGHLPVEVTIALRSVAFSGGDGNGGRVRFYPDGSSTGGHLELSKQQRVISVNIDWLTGRVGIAPHG